MKKVLERYERLDRLSTAIHLELKKEDGARWEQVIQFLEICWGIVKKNDYENLPDSFYRLDNELRGMLQYGYVERMDPNKAFFCGTMWAAARMAEMENKKEKETKELEELAKKYLDYKVLLLEMQNNPGIDLRELAKKTKINVSKVYDLLMIKLREERLFSHSNVGRHEYDKCCYLAERGEELLKLMEKDSK